MANPRLSFSTLRHFVSNINPDVDIITIRKMIKDKDIMKAYVLDLIHDDALGGDAFYTKDIAEIQNLLR